MPSRRFANLSPAQQRVFEQIAINQDGGHHPATLKALERRGMIESYKTESEDRLWTITRYMVPLPVHILWCEWCAEQPDTGDDTQQQGKAGERGVEEGE